jgi:hypothetical protein
VFENLKGVLIMASPKDGEVGSCPEHNMALIMKLMALMSKLSRIFLNLL